MNVNERQMNRMLMEKVGKKFYGHDTLKSKYEPQIPLSAEREYIRTTNAYMATLKASWKNSSQAEGSLQEGTGRRCEEPEK